MKVRSLGVSAVLAGSTGPSQVGPNAASAAGPAPSDSCPPTSGETRMERVRRLLSSPLAARRKSSHPGTHEHRVFGVPLDILMAKNQAVPFVLSRLCMFIEMRGMAQEGLFRVSGSAKLIDKLKACFDSQGDAPLEHEADIASAAGLLKTFFRELPEPLIPAKMYPAFLDATQSTPHDPDLRTARLRALIQTVPEENLIVLRYLCRFLYKVSQHEEATRMNASALGIVFGPNLFRFADDLQGLQDQAVTNQVVTVLIASYFNVFEQPLSVLIPVSSSSARPTGIGGGSSSSIIVTSGGEGGGDGVSAAVPTLMINDALISQQQKRRSCSEERPPSPAQLPLIRLRRCSSSEDMTIAADASQSSQLQAAMATSSAQAVTSTQKGSTVSAAAAAATQDNQNGSCAARRSTMQAQTCGMRMMMLATSVQYDSAAADDDDDDGGGGAESAFFRDREDARGHDMDTDGGGACSGSASAEERHDASSSSSSGSNHNNNNSNNNINSCSSNNNNKNNNNSCSSSSGNNIGHNSSNNNNNNNSGCSSVGVAVMGDDRSHDSSPVKCPRASAEAYESAGHSMPSLPKCGPVTTREICREFERTCWQPCGRKRTFSDQEKQRPILGAAARKEGSAKESSAAKDSQSTARKTPAAAAASTTPQPKEQHQPSSTAKTFSVSTESMEFIDKGSMESMAGGVTPSPPATPPPESGPVSSEVPPLDLAYGEEPQLSEHRFSWPIVPTLATPVAPFHKANSVEAPLSPSAYRGYLNNRSEHLVDDEMRLPPSPPVGENDFLGAGGLGYSHSKAIERAGGPGSENHQQRQLSKRMRTIKKKILAFEVSFEANCGHRPSHAEKMNDAQCRELLFELTNLRKEMKALQSEDEVLPEPAYLGWQRFCSEEYRECCTENLERVFSDTLCALADKRRCACRPEHVEDMTREQVVEEKLCIQKALLRFESVHGRPSSRADRDLMRPLYDRYRSVKRLIGGSSYQSVGSGSGLGPAKEDALQPIIEHVQMDFKSPPTPQAPTQQQQQLHQHPQHSQQQQQQPQQQQQETDLPHRQQQQQQQASAATTPFHETICVQKGEVDSLESGPTCSSTMAGSHQTHPSHHLHHHHHHHHIQEDHESSPPLTPLERQSCNLHELPLAELLAEQRKAKLEKRRVRKVLRLFEENFQLTTGRKVQREDRAPMEKSYAQYKHIKAKLRLMEALVLKHENQLKC